MERSLVYYVEKNTSGPFHEWIRAVGGKSPDGTRWKRSAEEVIADIRSGRSTYYIQNIYCQSKLKVGMDQGREYLMATMDERLPQSLLFLPDC